VDRLALALVYANRRANMLPVYALSLALVAFQCMDRRPSA